jgi:predicted TIM-barrel fold metal-dependent hydrolase
VSEFVDAHHHIWRQADLPWLIGPMQPRIFGPYEPIRRDYPIEEYLADLASSGVTKSVYVQTNWGNDRFEDETAWVQQTANQHGWPHGIVAFADFNADDVRPQLDRLARYPLVRGVRMQLHWHENPLYRFAARPDLCADAKIRRNIARLADYGWSFDLQVFAPQMTDAAGLAEACPKVTFVLQHAGMWEDLSDRKTLDLLSRIGGRPSRRGRGTSRGPARRDFWVDRHARLSPQIIEIIESWRKRCSWKSRFWTMAISSWNRVFSCSGATAAARAAS